MNSEDSGLPAALAAHFEPPAEFAGRLGGYRSPLLFADGTPVESAEDWQRRRRQIRRVWRNLMGPWPPILRRGALEVLDEEQCENYARRRVRLRIAPGQLSEGWLLAPVSEEPMPAVLVVFYEPETSVGLKPEHAMCDYGRQLARRGVVTLSIGTPGGDARNPDCGEATCQPLGFHAYVAANCCEALSALPFVVRRRIGVVGHSYGGKWALFAGAFWSGFAAVAVSDPGIVFDETRPNVNYWEPWYLGHDPNVRRAKASVPTVENPRTGAYRRMIERDLDLHEIHSLLAPRPFFVSGGSEDPLDRWIALNHLIAVNRLLGYSGRVGMTTRPEHSPDRRSNDALYAFFDHFLGPGAARIPVRGTKR